MLTDETQALIDKSNQLHAALMEQKKMQSAFLDRYHSTAQRLKQVSEALHRKEVSVDEWAEAFAEWTKVSEETPPKNSDPSDWMVARQDALEAMAIELGLRIRTDGV